MFSTTSFHRNRSQSWFKFGCLVLAPKKEHGQCYPSCVCGQDVPVLEGLGHFSILLLSYPWIGVVCKFRLSLVLGTGFSELKVAGALTSVARLLHTSSMFRERGLDYPLLGSRIG